MIKLQLYFTFWVLLLVIFHKYTHKVFSLPYLIFIVLTSSIYIFYINPGKFYIRYNNGELYELQGYKKIIVDIIFHYCVFAFIYLTYGMEPFFNNWKIISSLLLMLIYTLLYCPSDIYFLRNDKIVMLIFMNTIIYCLIYHFLV